MDPLAELAARTAPLVDLQGVPTPRAALTALLATTSRMLGNRAALTVPLAKRPKLEPWPALSSARWASINSP